MFSTKSKHSLQNCSRLALSSNLDFVRMVMQIFVKISAKDAFLLAKCDSLPPSLPARTLEHGVSYRLHIVRCRCRKWTSLWFAILHWSFLTPFRYTQQQSIAARSTTSLKLPTDTKLCGCNRLCFDKQFHCRNSELH